MELKDKLISQLDSQYFPSRGATLVAAVSGGVDSVVLLHILLLLSAKSDWELVAAHFNHQLRKTADKDAKFVKDLVQGLGLKFVFGSTDVKKLANNKKLTVEEAGRVARYAWLQKVARRYRAVAIVLGHTADDQAETVVMNWLRGGLIRALAGMRIQDGNLWRPFLGVKKSELHQFAKKYQIQFREDPSNQDTVYTRNLIRHQILPMLGKINPRIREVLVRNANSFAELEAWLDNSVSELYKKVSLPSLSGEINFSEKQFNNLPIFLQNELLLLAIQKLKGNRQDWEKAHLDEAKKVIASSQKTAWKQLPGKLFVSRGCGKISVSRHRPKFIDR